jgi:hypothetical protein
MLHIAQKKRTVSFFFFSTVIYWLSTCESTLQLKSIVTFVMQETPKDGSSLLILLFCAISYGSVRVHNCKELEIFFLFFFAYPLSQFKHEKNQIWCFEEKSRLLPLHWCCVLYIYDLNNLQANEHNLDQFCAMPQRSYVHVATWYFFVCLS